MNIHCHSSAVQWTRNADGRGQAGPVDLASRDSEFLEFAVMQQPGSYQDFSGVLQMWLQESLKPGTEL